MENISSTHFQYAVLSFFRDYLSDPIFDLGTEIEDRLDSISQDSRIVNVNLTYKNNDPNLKKIRDN